MVIYKLRKNASQKSIDATIAELKKDWQLAEDDAVILFHTEEGFPVYDNPGTYYLSIGGVVRYGFNGSFEAWGFGQNMVDREIAGMVEYRDRQYS